MYNQLSDLGLWKDGGHPNVWHPNIAICVELDNAKAAT